MRPRTFTRRTATGVSALTFTLLLTLTVLAGCVAPSGSEGDSAHSPFLVEGRITYTLLDGERELEGWLEVEGPFTANDRFLQPKEMVMATEQIGEAAEQIHWIDLDTRRIEITEKMSSSTHTRDFSTRAPVLGDAGITAALLLLHGRDWRGPADHAQYLQGHMYDLSHHWNGTELVVEAHGPASAFEMRYRFRTAEATIEDLEEVAIESFGDRHTYRLKETPPEPDAFTLNAESSMPQSTWKALSFERFLEETALPTTFTFQRAWAHLLDDPRATDWNGRDPRPIAAFYGSTTNDLGLATSRWSFNVQMEAGRATAEVEERQVQGQSLVPQTTKFEEVPAVGDPSPITGWYRWDVMLDTCAKHIGVNPAEVFSVVFGPPEFATGLDYDHVLRLSFRPEEERFEQGYCEMDTLNGIPLAAIGSTERFVI